MTAMTVHTSQSRPDNDASYNAGFLDGELDAISKLPAALATARASMATPHDPMWADGYSDGYLAQIQATYALTQKEQAA